MPRPEYIIEHMEEDEPDAPAHFPPWALLEYRHMLYHVGEGSTVHFTALSQASLGALQEAFSQPLHPLTKPAKFELHAESVTTLAKERNWDMNRICLLDPKAPLPLSVCDAGLHASSAQASHESAQTFTHFLFGGILGDDPPRDRTSSLRELGFPGRHLGSVQMSTDTALGVTKRVVEDGLRLGLKELDGQTGADKAEDGVGALSFVDSPTLDFGRGESVCMHNTN
ncbi:protein-arginine omega-N monomethyltransferase [Malassezia pachydermatis]